MERILTVAGLVGLLGSLGSGCGTSSAAGGGHNTVALDTVELSGPAPFDCDKHREQIRRGGEPSSAFLVDLQCRVHPVWTCVSFCQGRDERFVTLVTARIDRSGQLASSMTKTGSGQGDYDELSLAALRAGTPLSAPPTEMLDGTGVVPLNVQFSCDCRK
jgi:hypothetical protein